jgi:hypothetical protein
LAKAPIAYAVANKIGVMRYPQIRAIGMAGGLID